MFWKRTNKSAVTRQQDQRLDESQRVLIEAATATANAAQDVTQSIRNRLDDSMRQFEGTAKVLNDALLVCDLDGRVQSCNPAAGRMFGRTDLLTCTITDLFASGTEEVEDSIRLWHLIEHTSAWLPSTPEPLKGKRFDGRLFWIEPALTRLDWSDRTSSMLVLVRNIDPVVGLSESARSAKLRYQSVFEGSPDGVLIARDDTIMAANRSIRRMFGYPIPDLIGQPVETLFPARDHTRSAPSHDHSHFPIIGQSRDGHALALTFTSTAIAWNDAPARLITVKDLAEMRRIEEGVMNRENGVDLVCSFDREHRITYANRAFAEFYGLGIPAVLNRDIRTLLTDAERATLATSLATLSPHARSCRVQDALSLDTGYRVQDWIDHALFDAAGTPVEYQRIGRDLTTVIAGLMTGAPHQS